MKKGKISSQFRSRFSGKLMDLGNLVIAGFVFGQFVSANKFSLFLFIVGFAIALFCYIMSYIISI